MTIAAMIEAHQQAVLADEANVTNDGIMSEPSRQTLSDAYDGMGLLDICTFALQQITDDGENLRLAANIDQCITMANERFAKCAEALDHLAQKRLPVAESA